MVDAAAELRALFEKRVADRVPNPTEEFHLKDLERVQDDAYLHRVLQTAKHDMATASKMLWAIMKWRKMSGASDINQDNINMEYVNLGLFYPHGRDLSGCRMIIVKCRSYHKGQLDFEEVKKVMIYWLDRLEREEHGKGVTLFLDLDGAGLANFDIELIRYMISLFMYYPKFLNQIVIYQLPWILTATFKVVKRLLPAEAVEIMKFATKDNVLKEIVSEDQALTTWGGKNNHQFKFLPEKKNIKKVSFSSTVERQESSISNNSTISTMSEEDSTIPTNSTSDELFTVEPSDKITFRNENEEIVGRIKIKNLEEKPLAFKIRTTGPEKFWVRPCSGILEGKKTELILITILPGYEKTAMRERFSIMGTASRIDVKDLSEVWRTALNSDIEEHRLKCHIIEDTRNQINNNIGTNNVQYTPDFNKALDELKYDVIDLKNQVVQLKFYQFLSLVLGVMTLFLGYLIYKDVGVGEEL